MNILVNPTLIQKAMRSPELNACLLLQVCVSLRHVGTRDVPSSKEAVSNSLILLFQFQGRLVHWGTAGLGVLLQFHFFLGMAFGATHVTALRLYFLIYKYKAITFVFLSHRVIDSDFSRVVSCGWPRFFFSP